MRVHVGTSGYNYTEWRGTFYPEDLPTKQMFGYYSERFHTVEINYTFYRMPTAKTTGAWLEQAPSGFAYTSSLSHESWRNSNAGRTSAGIAARNVSSLAASHLKCGGSWNRSDARCVPSTRALSQKKPSSSSAFKSRLMCVIFCGAFSVKTNDSGVSAIQLVSSYSVGER